MKKFFALFAIGAALVVSAWASAPPVSAAGSGLDLLLVLDNSGSMKQNDPQFLTRAVVTEFVTSKRLPPDARVGVVMFADNATMTMPLTPLGDGDTRQRLQASLDKLDYSGRLTDTAAAVRADDSAAVGAGAAAGAAVLAFFVVSDSAIRENAPDTSSACRMR